VRGWEVGKIFPDLTPLQIEGECYNHTTSMINLKDQGSRIKDLDGNVEK
jgi:hypothetical protein